MNLLMYSMLLGYGKNSNRYYRHFKRGDRVVLTHSFKHKDNVGATGTIASGDGTFFYINWDTTSEQLDLKTPVLPMRITPVNAQIRN